MGPLNDADEEGCGQRQSDIKYPIRWTTLGEYLDYLQRKGIAPNVASFVGATTVRMHELGYDDRRPTPEQLARMRALVRPGDGGRRAGRRLLADLRARLLRGDATSSSRSAQEAAQVRRHVHLPHALRGKPAARGDRRADRRSARESGVPAEIYHFKAGGPANWGKLDAAITKIEDARAAGLRITADMYTYTAGATGLDAAMPPWVQDGGLEAWIERLKDPAVRARVMQGDGTPTDAWENSAAARRRPRTCCCCRVQESDSSSR